MNRSEDDVADVPFVVVTETGTVPGPCGGETAVIEVVLTNCTVVAEVCPKRTVAVFVNFVPVILTEVPPAVVPVPGETPVTVGRDPLTYVKASAEVLADVPVRFVTPTSTLPAT